jgi:hypothetical protein
MKMKKILILLFITVLCNFSNAQSVDSTKILPKVFLLGDYTSAHAKVHDKHPTSLFEFCKFDTEQAFDKWARFIIAMETYAESINYDIKGVKVWIEVCWENDGKIKYIAYAPKPDSRNISLPELSAFFKSFTSNYQPQFAPSKLIVQNSQANFPFLGQ